MILDQSVHELLGGARYKTRRVGIELELEGWGGDVYPDLDHWNVTEDASLRNGGVELVSLPLAVNSIPDALEVAETFIHEYDMEATERCGVHVHLNVANITWRQLVALAAEHALIQPWLFAEYGPGREKSHFCVPAWADSALARDIHHCMTYMKRGLRHIGAGNVPPFVSNCAKYASLNFQPIRRQQTIEFRECAGLDNMTRVREWVDLILKLEDEAVRLGSPDAVIEELDEIGIDGKIQKYMLPFLEGVIDEVDVEDAIDTAHFYCGATPVDWRTLNWEMN